MSHYYYMDGADAYTVTKKNGKIAKPDIRDARRLNLVPSVTTILGILNAPELVRWKINQVIQACIDHKYIGQKNYAGMIQGKAFEKSKTAMGFGNLLHETIECIARKEKIIEGVPLESIAAVRQHFNEEVAKIIAVEEGRTHKQGLYAGKPDLVCRLRDGRVCVYDYKNQGTVGKDKFAYYDKYWLQAAAYAKLVGADCTRILMVSRDEPGRVDYDTVEGRDLTINQNKFYCLARYFALDKKLIKGETNNV